MVYPSASSSNLRDEVGEPSNPSLANGASKDGIKRDHHGGEVIADGVASPLRSHDDNLENTCVLISTLPMWNVSWPFNTEMGSESPSNGNRSPLQALD